MTRQLVLVHGRAQQGKNPKALKQEWLDALDIGLEKIGKSLPIPESDVKFPFYGDTLEDLVYGEHGIDPAEIVVMGTDLNANEQEFLKQAMEEIRLQAGITEDEIRAAGNEEIVEMGPQNWGWVRAIARALDDHGFSGDAIALTTFDVYMYLIDKGIKYEIDSGVASAFTPGVETVVVGHSLGSVVAHAILRERGTKEGWIVPQYVTLGSPLAIQKIKQSIVPPLWPGCVKSWYNARDEKDIVALFPLTPDRFNVGDEEIMDATMTNDTPNKHGISGYLSDEKVAETIYNALTAD